MGFNSGFKGLNVNFHVSFRDLLHAANLRHGTDGFTSPPKEGALRIFFALKNPDGFLLQDSLMYGNMSSKNTECLLS